MTKTRESLGPQTMMRLSSLVDNISYTFQMFLPFLIPTMVPLYPKGTQWLEQTFTTRSHSWKSALASGGNTPDKRLLVSLQMLGIN